MSALGDFNLPIRFFGYGILMIYIYFCYYLSQLDFQADLESEKDKSGNELLEMKSI